MIDLPDLLLSESDVQHYLGAKFRARGILRAALLKVRGTASTPPGQPSVLFSIAVADGSELLVELPINLFSAISAGLLAGAGRTHWRWPTA